MTAQLQLQISPDSISPADKWVFATLQKLMAVHQDTPLVECSFLERASSPGFFDLVIVSADSRVFIEGMQFSGPDDVDPAVIIEAPDPWRDHALGLIRSLREAFVAARQALALTCFAATWADPPGAPVLGAFPLSVAHGQEVTATWWTSIPHAQDWISIYAVGAPDSAYGEWKYTDALAGGQLGFTAPTTPGSYEFRFFPNNSSTHSAVSPPFTVT